MKQEEDVIERYSESKRKNMTYFPVNWRNKNRENHSHNGKQRQKFGEKKFKD